MMKHGRLLSLVLVFYISFACSQAALSAAATREWTIPDALGVYIAVHGEVAWVLANNFNVHTSTLTQYSLTAPARPLYTINSRSYGLALSHDGRHLLISHRNDTGVEVDQLIVTEEGVEKVGEFNATDEWARWGAWSLDGKRWLSRVESHLTIHERNGQQLTLRIIPGTIANSDRPKTTTVIGAWPVPGEQAAYALVSDGRFYQCTAQEARLRFTFPKPIEPWNYAATEHVLYVLSQEVIYRVSLDTYQVEKKSLSAFKRELNLGKGNDPIYTLRAIDDDVVVIAVEPSPANLKTMSTSTAFSKYMQSHPGGIYSLQFSPLKMTRVMALEFDKNFSGRSLGVGDGLSFAVTKHSLWAVVINITKNRMTYKVVYTPLPQ